MAHVARHKVARYGKKFVVSDEDLVDDRLEAIAAFFAAIGREAAAVRPRLVWSIVLNNANLADSVALFDSGTRGNLGTGALDAANLATATSAMRGFSMADASGTAHVLNITPRFLAVPADLEQAAAALLRTLQINQNNDLALRVDARLGTGGAINPADNSSVVGTATNWFLFANPADAPVVEVAYRDGRREPKITQSQLRGGEWGLSYSINLDVGAKAIGWRGCYKSTGAA